MSLTVTRPEQPRLADPLVVEASPSPSPRQSWIDRGVALKVFVVSLLANFAVALFLAYVWEVGNADGLSRTANAWYVLYSRDPHLAAIGFVWPILPSLVQLPLLPFLRLIEHPELAGVLMSAASGAGTLAALSKVLGVYGVTGWTRLAWLLLIQVHPQFLYLAASGLAETPFMLCLCLAILALLKVSRSDTALAWLGASLAAAFFIRYEALALVAGVAAVLVVLQRWAPRQDDQVEGSLVVRRWPAGRLLVQWWPRLGDWHALEGRLLAAMAPPAYAVFLWVLLNWLIMGDPLYFQRSVFSLGSAPDVAQNNGPDHPLHSAMGSLPVSATYAVKRLTQVNLALPILAVIAFGLGLRTGDRQLLGQVALLMSIVAFTGLQVFMGSLPPFLRYWCYATPLALVLGAGCVHRLRSSYGRWMRPFPHVVTGMLLLAVFVNAHALGDWSASLDEQRLAAHLRGDPETNQQIRAVDFWWIRRHDSRLLAPVLDQLSDDGLTLIDVETGYPSILRVEHPEQLVISPDRDFRDRLAYPEVHLSYIALTHPRYGRARDLVNQQFPTLYEHGAPWARLLGEVEGTIQPWRIYEIGPDAATRNVGRAPEDLPVGLRPVSEAVASAAAPPEAAALPETTPAPSTARVPPPGASPTALPVSADVAPAASPPAAPPMLRRYVVAPGDTLSEIASRHETTTQRLVEINGVVDQDLIFAGDELRMPPEASDPDEPDLTVPTP
jgi:hypothetical protein